MPTVTQSERERETERGREGGREREKWRGNDIVCLWAVVLNLLRALSRPSAVRRWHYIIRFLSRLVSPLEACASRSLRVVLTLPQANRPLPVSLSVAPGRRVGDVCYL